MTENENFERGFTEDFIPERCPTCGSKVRRMHLTGCDIGNPADPWHATPPTGDRDWDGEMPNDVPLTHEGYVRQEVRDREPDPEWVVVTIGEGEDAERGLAMRDRERPEDVLRRGLLAVFDGPCEHYDHKRLKATLAALDALVAERRQAKEATAMIAEVAASLDRALAAERVRADDAEYRIELAVTLLEMWPGAGQPGPIIAALRATQGGSPDEG